ncbi:uncharacterized protein LOC143286734 isoform X2 [Babylonia areolata]|uniref:uncharacterized protein LOC143286734 isoform X2 n=1 Tax=Babylonia areolata TaxID=304850 RepID=UPI003FD528FC
MMDSGAMGAGPLQVAPPALTETFYDLNTHTVFTPQPTYPLPPAPHPPPPPHHHHHHYHHHHPAVAPPALGGGSLWNSSSSSSISFSSSARAGQDYCSEVAASSSSSSSSRYPHPLGVRGPREEEGLMKEEEEVVEGGRVVKEETSGAGAGGRLEVVVGEKSGGSESSRRLVGEQQQQQHHHQHHHHHQQHQQQQQQRTTPTSGEWPEEEDEGDEENSKDGDRMGDNSSHKHSQVEATLTWLTSNYERAEGVCLPRCVLYTHYLDFCKKHDFTPAGAATFGKIIRQKFPKLTTRRLGTRGQSKYHYYGIGIKESSVYYHSVYSGRGLTRFSGVKVKTEGSNRKYSLSSKTGTLLPDFPQVDNLILPEDVSSEKMQTFLMMYRTHCQRILDTIISANFDEVQNLLLHFWQGMPSHLTDVLTADIVCDIVALCDSILYKVLADVLLPSCIQDMPDNLGTEIKVFAKKMPEWLFSALDNVPEHLRERKMKASQVFARSIGRQLSFVSLAQTSRATLIAQEEVTKMSADLLQLDFRNILCQAFYTQPDSSKSHCDIVMDNFAEFHALLQKQAPVESYTEWIDSMVDTYVLQPCKDKGEDVSHSAAEFLMQWVLVGSLLKKDLTLLNSSSFASLHLVSMMLDEYVYLVMETQRDLSDDAHLQRQVQRHMRNTEAIKIHAKIRTGTTKMAAPSPKNRKRKQEADHSDSTEEMEVTSFPQDMKTDAMLTAPEELCLANTSPHTATTTTTTTSPSYLPHPGTAFTRPPPSAPRDPHYSQSEDSQRLAATTHGYPPLAMSPAKTGAAGYERTSYFSQFSHHLNTAYSDYVSHNTAVTSPRVPTHVADPHSQGFSQTFSATPGGPFSAGGGGLSAGGYHWGDGHASAAVLADPYSQYAGVHGVSSAAAYDSYKNAALLRAGPVYGQEAAALGLNAAAARGYFAARASDTYQGSSLAAVAPAYGGNFMEIAAPSGAAQYPARPEPLPPTAAYQEDLYASAMGPHSHPSLPAAFHKHYLATSFR